MKTRTKTTQVNPVIYPILILVLSLLASSCQADPNGALSASGRIEAREVSISPEMGGRVVEVVVDEGDQVSTGDVLFRLDDSLKLAEKSAAEAALAAAQAGVQTAQTSLEAARLQYDAVLDEALETERPNRTQDWSQNPPDRFDQPGWYFNKSEQIQALQVEVEAAGQALSQAEDLLKSKEGQVGNTQFLKAEERLSQARVAYQLAQVMLDLAGDASDGQKLRDSAQKAFDDAENELDDAQQAYDDTLTAEGVDEILNARAEVTLAQERYSRAQDDLRRMQTGADSPRVKNAGKSVDQAQDTLSQAQAAVKQAQAQLDLVNLQIDKLTVYAPQDGVVLTRSLQPGEVAQAGMTAMTVADLGELTITVYLSEDRYGEVSLGEQAALHVDSFPNDTFSAVVTRISDKAEYTQRNVQTQEERQTTVYAIELKVQNPTNQLKPGMPVDVEFSGG